MDKLIGNKEELISKLLDFADSGECQWKGQRPFIKFLIQYLRRNTMPGDDPKYANIVFIDQYFHKIILDAAVVFRSSNEDYAVRIRKEYEEETGYEVPDVYDFGMETSGFIQTHMQFVVEKVFVQQGRYISHQIDALCNAHYHFLNKVFRRFISKVWRTGVCELIEKASERGLKGVFGDVTLLTYTIIGRTVIQFDREDGSSVSYMTGEDDHMAYSAGINFCETDIITAVKMIETVIENWPEDKIEQAKIFFPDKDVKHWAVAVMEVQQNQEASEWIKLGDLHPGAVFMTQDGVRAVKSEYYYSSSEIDPQCQCVLTASGEYAHFPEKNDTLVKELEMPPSIFKE